MLPGSAVGHAREPSRIEIPPSVGHRWRDALAGPMSSRRSVSRRPGSRRQRHGTVMREGVQPAQLLVDGFREGERIELRPEGRELGDLRRVGLGHAWTRSKGVCGRS